MAVEPKSRELPHFGVNGAWLENPAMTQKMRAEYMGEGDGYKPRDEPAICKRLYWLALLIMVFAQFRDDDYRAYLSVLAAVVSMISLFIWFASLGEKSGDDETA